ncbi:hypothetical protein J2W57_002469 [Chryseobacterium ginsenosidimutans]|nr:hypothetical protein [Chryseobacterium ginsenosidimutans]
MKNNLLKFIIYEKKFPNHFISSTIDLMQHK